MAERGAADDAAGEALELAGGDAHDGSGGRAGQKVPEKRNGHEANDGILG